MDIMMNGGTEGFFTIQEMRRDAEPEECPDLRDQFVLHAPSRLRTPRERRLDGARHVLLQAGGPGSVAGESPATPGKGGVKAPTSMGFGFGTRRLSLKARLISSYLIILASEDSPRRWWARGSSARPS